MTSRAFPDRLALGLVGGGRAGSALLDLLATRPDAFVAVVVDSRADAPAVDKAKALGIPVGTHPLDVFAHRVDLVLEATGRADVLEELLRARPPGIEVVGARSLRFVWDLLEDRATHARQLRAQLDMAVALGSTLDLRKQMVLVARRFAELCGVDRCSIFLLDETTGLITPVMSQFSTGGANTRLWRAFKNLGRLRLEEVPFFYEVVERRDALEIHDPGASRLVPQGWTQLFDLKSVLVVPIFGRGRVTGVSVLDHCRERRFFTDDQILLATTLGSQISLAFENARLYQRAEARTRKLAALSGLTRLITSAVDVQEVFAAVAKVATTLLGARITRLWVDRPAEGGLRAQASYGPDDSQETTLADLPVVPYGRGIVARVFESRVPEYIEDVQRDPRLLNRRLVTAAGVHGFASVPLVTGDRTVGVLTILFGELRRFGGEDRELITLLADQAAIAIGKAELFEETERRRRAAETLVDLGRLISQSLDPEEVGRRIVESLVALFGARTAGLYRLDPLSGALVAVAVAGDLGQAADETVVFPPGVSAVGLAAETRRPVASSDVLTDPRLRLTPEVRARIERGTYRSTLALPLIVQERVLGCLAVGDRAERVFTGEEIRVAEAFANHSALALENARLYTETTQRRHEAQQAYDDLARAQAEVARGAALRATGELASGVAHHLNNLLTVVIGRLELALARSATDPERDVGVAYRAAQDGAEVVRRLTRFSASKVELERRPVSLNDVVEEVVELTRPRWRDEAEMRGAPIDVVIERAPIPPVAGHPASLREVVVNLLFNAVDALPAGGRITVRTWAHEGRVYCAVADTGIGMSPEVQSRALEPFFTTKGPQSTGLGLSVNFGIVQRHGGDLTIASAEGRGTAVTFSLPAAAPLPEGSGPSTVAGSGPPRRILLIDDDARVRDVIATMLAADGHHVVEAAGGTEGLEQVGAGAPFDLVLTDLGMPGMSGWDVARAVKASRPHLPVALITGWGETPRVKPEDRAAVDFVLAKPLTQDLLRALILESSARRSQT